MAYTLTYSYSNNAYTVTGYTGEPVDIIIPNTYNDGVNGEHPVMSIQYSAFYSCSSLTSITIPDSVTSIGDRAFASCSSLKNITIPNSVTSIGQSAFANCSSLTSITIGNSVTSIEYGAFASCSSLISVTIPNSVTSIGDYAFYNCSGLTSITIGNSVTSIGNRAFHECRSLTSINLLPKIIPTLGTLVFLNINSNAKFYCFQSAIDDYKSATNWNTYASKFVADDIRLYFILNANASKKYFVSQDSLINLANNTIADGDSLTDEATKGLINQHRPIKVNDNTFYFTKENQNEYVYVSANLNASVPNVSVITINKSSWLVNIFSADVSGGGVGGSSITVDDAFSATSRNPVENRVVKAALDNLDTDLQTKTTVLTGSATPTTSTVAAFVGQLFIVNGQDVYTCTAINNGAYTWEQVSKTPVYRHEFTVGNLHIVAYSTSATPATTVATMSGLVGIGAACGSFGSQLSSTVHVGIIRSVSDTEIRVDTWDTPTSSWSTSRITSSSTITDTVVEV